MVHDPSVATTRLKNTSLEHSGIGGEQKINIDLGIREMAKFEKHCVEA